MQRFLLGLEPAGGRKAGRTRALGAPVAHHPGVLQAIAGSRDREVAARGSSPQLPAGQVHAFTLGEQRVPNISPSRHPETSLAGKMGNQSSPVSEVTTTHPSRTWSSPSS